MWTDMNIYTPCFLPVKNEKVVTKFKRDPSRAIEVSPRTDEGLGQLRTDGGRISPPEDLENEAY